MEELQQAVVDLRNIAALVEERFGCCALCNELREAAVTLTAIIRYRVEQ